MGSTQARLCCCASFFVSWSLVDSTEWQKKQITIAAISSKSNSRVKVKGSAEDLQSYFGEAEDGVEAFAEALSAKVMDALQKAQSEAKACAESATEKKKVTSAMVRFKYSLVPFKVANTVTTRQKRGKPSPISRTASGNISKILFKRRKRRKEQVPIRIRALTRKGRVMEILETAETPAMAATLTQVQTETMVTVMVTTTGKAMTKTHKMKTKQTMMVILPLVVEMMMMAG